jgi:uncharacterized protein (TIGR00369 family)
MNGAFQIPPDYKYVDWSQYSPNAPPLLTNNERPTARRITTEQRQYAKDALDRLPLAKLFGMELVDIDLDKAAISVVMRDDLRQPSGVLHGGVTASLIDTAMAFAVRTRLPINEATATIDLTIHYLRPHTTGTCTCTAVVVRAANGSLRYPPTL